MALSVGARLGPYEIIDAIGSGGMGEVYRARDTRLDRTVAVKVLPPHLAADPQLRERFDREARALSSLNHPHICALYDVGQIDGTDYLVLEHLHGETLADRLARVRSSGAGSSGKGLEATEALAIAIEIAAALDAAHRAGIVHRDLKPANVFLVRHGAGSAPATAKLLDFGLAKAAVPVVATGSLSMLPTTPPALTVQGTILGTFQYMAPEQIEGLEADPRTDIFALGALLFEMLTGRPPFEGETRASLLGAILKDTPPRVSQLQPLAPAALDRVVETCLAKHPDDRYQTARDLLRDLKWVASGTADRETPPPHAVAAPRSARVAWAAAAMLGTAALGMAGLYFREAGRQNLSPPIQFTIPPPERGRFGGPIVGSTGQATQVAVAPDGRAVAFVAATPEQTYMLWVRRFDEVAAAPLAGTEQAAFPFWSPDSRFIGFFAAGRLKRIPAGGGPAISISETSSGRGGTWNADNTIVFAPRAFGPLQRVPASGGQPTPATTLDKAYGDTDHLFPHFLPDGRHFLYTAATGLAGAAPKPSVIRMGALDSPDVVTLFAAESPAVYTSGHILYLSDTTLMARPFDAGARRAIGEPFPVAGQVATEDSRYASFSASAGGVMAIGRGGAARGRQLTWVDRSGAISSVVGGPMVITDLALSPDERRAAVARVTGSPPNWDIWVVDLERAVASRLTSGARFDMSPVWSPDGNDIAFFSVRPSGREIRVAPANGSTSDRSLLKADASATYLIPTSWSRDGRFLAFTKSLDGPGDLWTLPMTGDAKPSAFVQSAFSEDQAVFSPDGRWIAYVSNESGQPQVYVQPFPATGGKYQVSRDGGGQPRWRGDGRELFFVAPDSTLMVAPTQNSRQFEAGVPRALFPRRVGGGTGLRNQYSVTKDGTRFLIAAVPETATSEPITVMVNWLAALRR